MHRIDQDGHVDNLFSEGNPELGQQATRVGADWLNAVQEEIANAVEGGGAALDREDNGQLATILANRTSRLGVIEDHVEDDEWIYPTPKGRSVLVPLQVALPYAVAAPNIASHDWLYGFDSAFSATQRVWMGSTQGQILELPIGHHLPSGALPTGVQLLARPATAGRTTANRLLVEVVRQDIDFGYTFPGNTPYANVPTSTVLASARDNGTDALQQIIAGLGGQPEHDRHTNNLFVRITAGLPGVRSDLIVALRLSFTDPGPRNA